MSNTSTRVSRDSFRHPSKALSAGDMQLSQDQGKNDTHPLPFRLPVAIKRVFVLTVLLMPSLACRPNRIHRIYSSTRI